MAEDTLAAPVAKLLELGEPKYARDFAWPDYLSLGLNTGHISALIAIAVDPFLLALDDHDPRGWGPVHAWRALGQLRAEAAVEPLMELFHAVRDNDWVIEEMPDVFALIGPAAFPALATYLKNPTFPIYSRLIASTSITQIALHYPHVRDAAVAALAEQLAGYAQNTPGANGVLIANLVELAAFEHTELIRAVFTECKVDRFIAGDWRDVKQRLKRSNTRPVVNENSLKKSADSTPPDGQKYQEPRTSPVRRYQEPRT